MLDSRWVSENLEVVRAGLEKRGFRDEDVLRRLIELVSKRRETIVEVEKLRAERNQANDAMAKLAKTSSEFALRRDELKALGDRIKTIEPELKKVEETLEHLLLELPNLPHESTPLGKDASDNVV